MVPNVTINLYQEGTAPDGSDIPHPGRHHQDQQLGRLGAGLPVRRRAQHELPGPGSHRRDLFFFTLFNQPKYLDFYNSSTAVRRAYDSEQLAVQVL